MKSLISLTQHVSAFLFSFFLFQSYTYGIELQPLAPALYVFGDSLFDSGNNNFLPTLARADFLPYGVNFVKGVTGRFTNGRTVADFIAEYLGLPYPPPYMRLRRSTVLTGLNFASGSCGILPETGSILGKCLSLREQISLFQWAVERDIKQKFSNPNEMSTYLSKSIFIFSVGSNDYINNYLEADIYGTSKHYAPQPFAEYLVDQLSHHLERIYELGARKIIVFDVGPIGCIPALSKTNNHTGQCMEQSDMLVSLFNRRIPAMLRNLTSSLPGSTFVLGLANRVAYKAIQNPSLYGMIDSRNPCCVTWNNGTSGCIPLSAPCSSPNKHFFFDAFHLTEAACSIIATRCFIDRSVCTPFSIRQLIQM